MESAPMLEGKQK